MHCLLLELVGKPFKSCSHTKKKKKKKEEENSSFQKEPAWESKALSRTCLILYARCNQSNGQLLKTGVYYHSKRVEPRKVWFCFAHKPDAFCSRRVQWRWIFKLITIKKYVTLVDKGVTLDQTLFFQQHVSCTYQVYYFELCQISPFRHYLTHDALKTSICTFVLSHIDYCNSPLAGWPQNLICKL